MGTVMGTVTSMTMSTADPDHTVILEAAGARQEQTALRFTIVSGCGAAESRRSTS